MARAFPASRVDRGSDEATSITTGDGLEVRVLESIHGVDPDRWNGVVDRSTCGSVFHRHGWLAAIEDGLEYPPKHLLVEKDGNPIGLLPNVSAPLPKTPFHRLTSVYPGFGGPLATTDEGAVLEGIASAVPTLCSGRRIVHEIRACNPQYLRYGDSMREFGYRSIRVGGRFVLELDRDYEDIIDGMSRSRRRAIERGRREVDHEIHVESLTRETLERFHDRYASVMDRVGGDTYPLAFFEALQAMEDRVLLLSLFVEGEYVGGFLELLDEEQSAVHGFFAAVPSAYFDVHATELLYDFVIRWAKRNGYRYYDFGGSVADFEDGTFQFKESFGGRLVPNIFWERGTGVTWPVVRRGRSLYWRYK